MKLRQYKGSEDFKEFTRWWDFWGWKDRVPENMLSDIGLVIEHEGVPICAGWLYLTNSPMASIEWVVSNPKVDRSVRSEALDRLVESLILQAKEFNASIVMTSITNKSFMSRIEALGFIKGDTGISQFFRRV